MNSIGKDGLVRAMDIIDRDNVLLLARIAEQSEQYDDMIDILKPYFESKPANEDLTIDDQIDSIEVLAVVHEEPEQRSATYQCEMCEYNEDFEDEIKRHMCKKLFFI